jgi:hypothetical protein
MQRVWGRVGGSSILPTHCFHSGAEEEVEHRRTGTTFIVLKNRGNPLISFGENSGIFSNRRGVISKDLPSDQMFLALA